MSRAVKDPLPPTPTPLHFFICVFVLFSKHWDLLKGSRSEVFDVEIDERLEEAGKRVEQL